MDGSIEHKPRNDEGEDPDVVSAQVKIRELLLTDRGLHDKAAKAYVSFVRAYSKHEASYIFRLRDLDLVGVAKCFGLLRLPRMPELDKVNRGDWIDADVDVSNLYPTLLSPWANQLLRQWDTYAYADKQREAKRLAEVETQRISQEDLLKRRRERAEKKKANAAWSNKVVRQEEKEKRQVKKGKRREWLKQSTTEVGEKRERAVSDEEDADADDWGDLAREERMAKKVKKGLVSQDAFDGEFGEL